MRNNLSIHVEYISEYQYDICKLNRAMIKYLDLSRKLKTKIK